MTTLPVRWRCEQPIVLAGWQAAADPATGEMRAHWDGRGLRPCGSRDATRCAWCSREYRRDTYRLTVGGCYGAELAFVTLTPPSFGGVHRRATARAPLCRPRRTVCGHGRPEGCFASHSDRDPRCGTPLCPDCYDFEAAGRWRARVTRLFRRTPHQIRRQVARELGRPLKQIAGDVQYARFREDSRRGVPHVHVVVAWRGTPLPPGVLERAVRAAAAVVRVDGAGWGGQVDFRPVDRDPAASRRMACYASKMAGYSVKGTASAGCWPGR